VRTLKDGIVVELRISRQPFAAPAIDKGFGNCSTRFE
jgi:hypothetical protein